MGLYTVAADQVALSAGTVKSLVELTTSASGRAKITAVSVTFDGVSATAVPGLVEIRRATATMTGTAYTPLPLDPADSGPAVVTAKVNGTAEGTVASTALMMFRVHPQAGLVYQFPLGQEPTMAASSFLRVRCNFAAAVNATVTVTFEDG